MGSNLSIQHFSHLTETNWLQYALNNYDNPHLTSLEEFDADLKRIKYILTLINRYQRESKDLQLNLLVNHVIILINCFGPEAAKNLLFYRLPEEHHPVINTILYFLKVTMSINIDSMDGFIFKELQKL